MNIEEYCIEKEKTELLKNFMLDIDPISNMGGAESAIFTSYCNKKHLFNFKCHICNTEWQGSAYSYIVKELACPECNENSTHQKIKYASVKQGAITLSEWCDDNKEQGQRIVDEYDDENNELTREEVFRMSYSSHISINWKCREHGHRWSATVKTRTTGSNCPYCVGRKVSNLNSLYTWCLENPVQGHILTNQWTGMCEDGKHYTMDEVSYGSNTKMLWRDEFNHEWYAPILRRTQCNSGCPYCTGKKVSDLNSLSTWCLSNKEQGQIIKSDWTGISEDGKHYTMDEITYGSGLKMIWECNKCKHKWYATVNDRTNGHNCNECADEIRADSIRKVRTTAENLLSTWCLENHVQGQILIEQWTGISEDDKHYTMDEVAYASNIKMLWRCKDGHEWYAIISHRTSGRGCPHCNKRGTSYPEQYIYWSLKQLYPETQNRYCDFKSDTDTRGVEYDVYVKELRLYIEYSPTYWHNSRKERDEYKKQLCEQNNVRLVQIIEDNYNEYEEIFTEKYICIPHLTPSNRDNYLLKIVSYILDSIEHSIDEIDIDLVKKNALIYSTGTIEYEKSVEFIYPALAAEFHTTLNTIKPNEVTPGSNIKVKFLCPNCGYGSQGEWETTIVSKVHAKLGCKQCGYNWHKAETNQPQNIKSQYRKPTTPSKPKPFKYVELSDIDKEMQSWDF